MKFDIGSCPAFAFITVITHLSFLDSWSIAGVNVFRISWAQHSISTRFSWSVTEILWPCYLLQCPHAALLTEFKSGLFGSEFLSSMHGSSGKCPISGVMKIYASSTLFVYSILKPLTYYMPFYWQSSLSYQRSNRSGFLVHPVHKYCSATGLVLLSLLLINLYWYAQ